MSWILVACLITIGTVLIIDLWAWLVIAVKRDDYVPLQEPLPEVAILLPVRNEEEYLPACLQSLLGLDYPPEKLHILVGNDGSTDRTLSLAEEWSRQHSQISVINVHENFGLARGKANVLAQLARQCPAHIDCLLMTDADIRPHPQWVRRMLSALQPGVGVVNGTTAVCGNGWWARWQQTDWAVALGLAKAYTYLPLLGKTMTAIGNNMLISREAYRATGGYENIPFSITEDYELMRQVCRRGYKAVQLMDKASSACTEPVHSVRTLLHQRKRWMTGAMRLPLPMIFLLFMQALFFPAIVVVLWLQPIVGLGSLLLKVSLQWGLAWQVLLRLGIKKMPAAGFLYELYAFILNLTLIVFYFLPLKIRWKDRSYQSNQH